MDDKAIIPVGENERTISTGVVAQNPLLGSLDSNPSIAALDHDWKIAGTFPFVNLFLDIPELILETFFSGEPAVTLIDRDFQNSCLLRHEIELTAQIKIHVDNFLKPVLLLITDSGA